MRTKLEALTRRIRRGRLSLTGAEWGLARASGLVLFFMMLLISADIFMRAAFNDPIQLAFELAELLMVFVVFLGFAYTQREGGFIRVELLLFRLRGVPRRLADYLNYILSIVFFIIFSSQSVIIAWDAFVTGERTRGLVPMLLWPARTAIAVAGIFLLVELTVGLVRYYRRKI